MPRPETRGFLERRRARRASVAVAAGPERGDAPREGSRGALCSRYASTISRRQQLSAATDRRRSTFIYFEAYAHGNRVYKIRKSTESRSHKKIPRIFFSVSDSSPEKRFFAEELSVNHQSSRHFSSAQHDTHQLTPCRFSSRLVRPPPVFPSRNPSHLLFAFTAARPPPAPRSTDPRRIDCCIFDRASIASPRIRASRRPRATARHPR